MTNFTEGTVSVIDTNNKKVVDEVKVGGNPYGITVVGNDVFVTQFFARLIPANQGGRGEGSTMARKGWYSTSFATTFTWTRSRSRRSPIPGSPRIGSISASSSIPTLAPNNTFCPDPNATDPNDPVIAQAVAAVFPNQLKAALACDGLLYLPNVGAQPEPPVAGGVNFDTNVQALVHVVDIASRTEREDLTVNLNQQIATEPAPDPVEGGASPSCSAMTSWRWTRTTTARTSSS